MARAVALVGTTASGKSRLALEVAERLGDLEIVSVDSMAVYTEMDIATAKPTPHDRERVPHHLIDVLDPSEECTVALFQQLAFGALDDVTARNRRSLLVGGTGLYHRAVIDRLEIPGRFDEARGRLDAEATEPGGLARLYARLCEVDPVAAGRIEPDNARRIVRALEVIEGTGRPFSSFGPGLEAYGTADVIQVGMAVDLEAIDRAIEERVLRWMAEGLLDEVRRLAVRPGGLSRTARQAIGYRELLTFVEEGGDLDVAVEATMARTRSLARRQRSWFRRDPRVRWCSTPAAAAEELARAFDEVDRASDRGAGARD